jgi:hypothetical protein
MYKVAFGIAAAAAFALASPATASVILGTGPGVLQPDEKLLFGNNPAPGPVIEGLTNQSNTLVTIAAGETLTPAGGQTRLDSTDGKISTLFTFKGFADQLAAFDLADPALGFTNTEFRIFRGTATELTLTFVDTAGAVFQQTFGIPANGFFNAQAVDGQLIDYFTLSANGTIGDIRQFRIGGITAIVPEPATWAMMLLGFGAAGAALRTRRRLTLA